jgi:signal transduction histidine kinase
MSPLAQTFLENIEIVFFFYGLSFFCMGLAVLLESGRSAAEFDFAKALRPLGVFGLIHGSHEWFEMLLISRPELAVGSCNSWISLIRIILLATSFIFLVGFGAGLLGGKTKKDTQSIILGAVTLIWISGLAIVFTKNSIDRDCLVSADVYTRYSLAIPGASLTAWGLMIQRKNLLHRGLTGFGNDLAVAAFAFLLYGVIGQLFASPSAIYPSQFINTDAFIRLFGFPVQVFRAIMATVVAVFIIRSLRASEVANQRHLEALREAQLAERSHYDKLRAELLHRTVKAQESERQRIAHELHDETGQTLTGLGMGLRALADNIQHDPERAIQQAQQLENLALHGIEELQHLVSGLHPPQLDDLGLMAALRWYTEEMSQRYPLSITLKGKGNDRQLPQDVRVVFFRIAQEAITNVIRHAKATQVSIELLCNGKSCFLRIEDDGCGFKVKDILEDTTRPHWGLLGMQERATLIQGNLVIESNPGFGTLVLVEWERNLTDE